MCSENSPDIVNNHLQERDESEKRRDYLEWDEYFMAITFLQLDKCPNNQKNDAALVLNHRQIIVSMDCSSIEENELDFKNHAEYKVLTKITKGTTMYTTSFPCEKCIEFIACAGISEIVYYQDKVDSDKAKNLLNKEGVTYRQFVSKKEKVEIDFSKFYDS